MLRINTLVQPELDPAAAHAFDVLSLAEQIGWLRVYSAAGDGVSLGRYHLAPAGGAGRLHRRLGGGRIAPFGPGFATIALTLPHRSALVAPEPLALRPEQVLNRCVRALMVGLRGLGADAFYPGRDRITVSGRLLALVALEVDARGRALFETTLAVDGDWLRLPELLMSVDAGGVLAVEELEATQVTTLAALGRAPSLEELAGRIGDAFAAQFGAQVHAASQAAPPREAAESAAQWLASRSRRPELTHHAVTHAQIGLLEAYVAVDGGAIADVVLAGDFIADSPSVAELERRMRGCPLEPAAIGAVVDAVYGDPRHFLLGLGPLDTVADTIWRAAADRP